MVVGRWTSEVTFASQINQVFLSRTSGCLPPPSFLSSQQDATNLPPGYLQVATKLPPSCHQVTTMFQPKSPPTTNWRDKMSLHRCSIDRSHLLCVRNSRESRPLPLIMMIMLVTVMAVVVMMTREGDDNHEGGWWVSKGSSVLPFRLQGISRQESFRQLPQIPTPHTIIKSKCLKQV